MKIRSRPIRLVFTLPEAIFIFQNDNEKSKVTVYMIKYFLGLSKSYWLFQNMRKNQEHLALNKKLVL